MLRSRIIPSLLMSQGGLVKTQEFAKPKYVGDPINAVKIFNEKEVDELAIFDISATKEGRGPDFTLLERISKSARMPLGYGGGVTTPDEAARLVALGYEKVSISAAALKDPSLVSKIAERIGAQSTLVTIDVRRASSGGGLMGMFRKSKPDAYQVSIQNGTIPRSEELPDLIRTFTEAGAGEIVINSIDRDGMMEGYDLELARRVRDLTPLPLTFLGGAGTVDHMQELIDTVGVVGAAAGSLFVFKGKYRAVLISYARPERLVPSRAP